MITINGQKMSKSLGNSLTVKDALKKYQPEVIKYMLMQKHYSSTVDINDTEFLQAEKHMYYFYQTFKEIDKFLAAQIPAESGDIENNIYSEIEVKFQEAMDDDFNTAAAYAYLFTIMKFLNTVLADKKIEASIKAKVLKDIKDKTIELYNLLAIFEENPKTFLNNMKNKYLEKLEISAEEIEEKIEARKNAKLEKNYALADEIRNELDVKGIVLLDTKEGTNWGIKELQ